MTAVSSPKPAFTYQSVNDNTPGCRKPSAADSDREPSAVCSIDSGIESDITTSPWASKKQSRLWNRDTGREMVPDGYYPRWSNCLFWALNQVRRHGGYIVFRRGHNGVPFHALWSPDLVSVWSYKPLKPTWRLRNWRDDLLLVFKGHVVKGDDLSPSGLPALSIGATADPKALDASLAWGVANSSARA